MTNFKNKQNIFLFVLATLVMFVSFAFATTISGSFAGPKDFKASSSNYQFDAEVGHPAVGESVSQNFIFDHGAYFDDSTTAKIKWLLAESRVGTSGTNDDMIFYLKFKQNGNTVYTTSLLTSSSDGTYMSPILLDLVPPGTYDVYVKGSQTLTKKFSNVQIVSGENILNFTQTNVANTTKGTTQLIAGDITGIGNTINTLGDDAINASDIGVILGTFSQSGTSNSLRGDINHDTTINASDIGIILKNFGQTGDN